MRFDDFNLDEVLEEYDRVSKRDGLDKTSTLVMAEDILYKSAGQADISFYDELHKSAKEERDNWYNVLSGGDLIDEAHPEGDKKMEGIEAADGLGIIEGLKGQHKKIVDLVSKDPSAKTAMLVKGLVALSNQLDSAGFEKEAFEVDRVAGLFVKAAFAEEQLGQLEKALNMLRTQLLMAQGPAKEEAMGKLEEVESAVRSVTQAFSDELSPNLAPLKSYLDELFDFMDFPSSWQAKEVAKDALNRLEEGVSLGDAQKVEVESQKPHRGMLAVQKKLNQMLADLGSKRRVPENGVQNDKATWAMVTSPSEELGLGLKPGVDFSNYRQLMTKLDEQMGVAKDALAPPPVAQITRRELDGSPVETGPITTGPIENMPTARVSPPVRPVLK